MKYSDITQRIIGCAMRVHSTLGNGFQEVIYQRALQIEMKIEGLQCRFPRKSTEKQEKITTINYR